MVRRFERDTVNLLTMSCIDVPSWRRYATCAKSVGPGITVFGVYVEHC